MVANRTSFQKIDCKEQTALSSSRRASYSILGNFVNDKNFAVKIKKPPWLAGWGYLLITASARVTVRAVLAAAQAERIALRSCHLLNAQVRVCKSDDRRFHGKFSKGKRTNVQYI